VHQASRRQTTDFTDNTDEKHESIPPLNLSVLSVPSVVIFGNLCATVSQQPNSIWTDSSFARKMKTFAWLSSPLDDFRACSGGLAEVDFMTLGLIGQKVGMTQVYDDKGIIAPVTVLRVGPCPVLLRRNSERDGYEAVQIGFLDKKRKKATRAERGHVASDMESKRRRQLTALGKQLAPKANCEPQRFVREFRVTAADDIPVGKVLTADEVFKDIGRVDVTGTTKGRGTTGTMKRYNFHGLPASHGVKKHHRSPGSIGSHASNRGSGRPKLGHKGIGRYGAERVTIRNLRVVKVDPQNHLILVEGAVPGPNGGMIMIQPTNKKTGAGHTRPEE
jgi:large subunit ribosomal protein L3